MVDGSRLFLPATIRRAQSGQVPCSGARRQNKALDEVSAAILGGVAAENQLFYCFLHNIRKKYQLTRKKGIVCIF